MPESHLERVFVTGATGTLGYNIVQLLGQRHPETRLQLLMRTPDETLFAALPNVEILHGDLANLAASAQAVRDFQPNAILHCAASGVRPSHIDWFAQIHLNVAATVALFEAASHLPDCHFLHISTGLVYAPTHHPCREHDPIDTLHPYGASKAAADCLLRAGAARLGRRLTVVRPFSFTGLHDGGDRLFPSLLRAAATRRPLAMSAGTQLRDFCAVQDIAEGILTLLQSPAPAPTPTPQDLQQVVNLGSGRAIPLHETVSEVINQLGLQVELELGARPLHPLEPTVLVADITRARALGWKPRTNLAYAVHQLAQSQYPSLNLKHPTQFVD